MTGCVVACVQVNPCVGAIERQVALIQNFTRESFEKQCDVVAFPELFLTGYIPGDLLLRSSFQDAVARAIVTLTPLTQGQDGAVLFGAPVMEKGHLFNAVILLKEGKATVLCRKRKLPYNGVFDEKRWFTQGHGGGCLTIREHRIGVMICADMWSPDVSEILAKESTALLVLNASPYDVCKRGQRLETARMRVAENRLPLLYLNMWGGQDNMLFDGCSFALDKDGKVASLAPSWQDAVMLLEVCKDGLLSEKHHCKTGHDAEKILLEQQNTPQTWYQAAVAGLGDYVRKNAIPGVIIGLSGGLDSALVATLAVDALGCERVLALTMPSSITSKETLEDAILCAEKLGISCTTLGIEALMEQTRKNLESFQQSSSLVEENIQARLRALLLMAVANHKGWMLLTTSNRSELSLGYGTLYGDMCGGYTVLKDFYKTQINAMARWRNTTKLAHFCAPEGEVIPQSILKRPPTAELAHGQTDEKALGASYETIDAILMLLEEKMLPPREVISQGYRENLVTAIVKRIKESEHKRYQASPGPRIHEQDMTLTRRFPITNAFPSQMGSH